MNKVIETSAWLEILPFDLQQPNDISSLLSSTGVWKVWLEYRVGVNSCELAKVERFTGELRYRRISLFIHAHLQITCTLS